MYLHCKKRRRRWILILKRWNPNTFLFSYLPILFLVLFFFLWSIYLYLHCKKRIWTSILTRWNPITFLFSYLPVLFLVLFFVSFFFYDQYTCIFTVKKKKMNPYVKKMKSKNILIFLSNCILLLICLIHLAFLT